MEKKAELKKTCEVILKLKIKLRSGAERIIIMEKTNEKNYAKQLTYAERMAQLKRAMKNGFYFECIFLEYAVMEDRTESVLRHAGKNLTNKRGNPLSLFDKLKQIRKFNDKFISSRLNDELLDAVDNWRSQRNELVHLLMKDNIPADVLRDTAENGFKLILELDRKVKSVNNYLDKKNT